MSLERQQRIIATLQSRGGWVSGPELAQVLGIARRTLQLEIKHLNQDGREVQIESNRRLGYRLKAAEGSPGDGAVPRGSSSEGDSAEVPTAKSEHRDFLIESQMITALLMHGSDMSIESLAAKLYISRSTALAHFDRVKRIVPRTAGARLVSITGRGVRIEADERAARTLLMKCGGAEVDAAVLDAEERRRRAADLDRLRHLVADLFITYSVMATSDAFESFVRYLAVSIERSRKGFMLEEAGAHALSDDGVGTDDRVLSVRRVMRDLAVRIRASLGYALTPAELDEVAQVFQELNLVRSEAPTASEVDDLIDAFEGRVQEMFGFRLGMSRDLRQALGSHVARLGERLSSGRPNVGDRTSRLFASYPLATHLLRTCLAPILGMEIPDAELSYMVMYLAVAIEELRDKLQILLVSDKSAAAIFELERRLGFFADEAHGIIRTVPTYMYRANIDVYSAWAHVLVTTDSKTALGDQRFLLVDDDQSRRQLDAVRAEILKRRAEMSAQELADVRRRFPVEEIGDAQAKELIVSLVRYAPASDRAAMQDVAFDVPASCVPEGEGRADEGCVSLETIGPSMLCAVQSLKDAQSSFSSCEFSEPIRFAGKRIERVIIARYGGEVGIVAFFERLRDLMANAR